jgi:hypothetical protein
MFFSQKGHPTSVENRAPLDSDRRTGSPRWFPADACTGALTHRGIVGARGLISKKQLTTEKRQKKTEKRRKITQKTFEQ